MTPLQFLCNVYRDESRPEAIRIAAAEAALPYVHPKLAMIAVDQRTTATVTISQEEARRQALAAFDAAFGLDAEPEPPPAPPLIEPPVKPEEIEIKPEADPILATKQKNIGLTLEQREARLQTPNGPLGGRPREFAREGALEADRSVARLPVRHRRPRPIGSGWSA